MPNMKKLKRMFGLDLTTLLKATNKSIPYVVEKCVEEIERRGEYPTMQFSGIPNEN